MQKKNKMICNASTLYNFPWTHALSFYTSKRSCEPEMNRCMRLTFPPFNHIHPSSLASLEVISYFAQGKDLLSLSIISICKTKHSSLMSFEELVFCNSSFLLHSIFVFNGGLPLFDILILSYLQAKALWPYFPHLKQWLSNKLCFLAKNCIP